MDKIKPNEHLKHEFKITKVIDAWRTTFHYEGLARPNVNARNPEEDNLN